MSVDTKPEESNEETVPFRNASGPGYITIFTPLFDFVGSNPIWTLSWMKKMYGDVIRLYLPVGGWTCLLSDPDGIQRVIEKNQKNYKKATQYEDIGRVMGDGLLTSEGDKWLQQHRLMMPMFHRKSIKNFGGMIMDEARTMIERWEQFQEEDEPIDLMNETTRITLRIICRALFSWDLDEHGKNVRQIGEDIDTLRRQFRSRVLGYRFPDWVPTPLNRKSLKAEKRLDEIINEIIDERRGQEEEYEDFLSMLMLAEDEETGATMSQEQIRDEVITFFLAGHETTATALAWTWYELNDYPEIHSNLHEHADSILDGYDEFSYDLYEDLDYAGQVVDESMRLNPPVPVIAREAADEDVVAGYHIPEGTTFLLSQYLAHRDPEIWDDPEEFNPERFAGDKQDERHPYSYFPFGGGARMCIGRELALLEARLIISQVVRRFRLERTEPNRSISKDYGVTMSPGDPIMMDVNDW